jgi:hypothetical protein
VQDSACRLSPSADVRQTGKHFPRTATAASRFAFDIAFGSTLVAVIIGAPRSVPTELIMNRSVTDDRAVPSRSSISRSDAVRPPSSQYPPAVPDRSKYQPASQRSVFQSCARLLGGVGAVH